MFHSVLELVLSLIQLILRIDLHLICWFLGFDITSPSHFALAVLQPSPKGP